MTKVDAGDIMGVVLAGGHGTRLRPHTATASKHLLPVGDEPLIARTLRQLARAGIRDVVLVIDERHASEFLAALRDGRHLDLRGLAYLWQDRRGLGMPTAIGMCEPHLRTDTFIVACGDVLVEDSLADAVAAYRDQGVGARIVGTYVEDTAGYTPLRVHGGHITGIDEKDPRRHGAGPIDLGFYCYHRDVFDRIRRLRPSARGETEIWELNRTYLGDSVLTFSALRGWWADVGGSLDTYDRVVRRWAA